MKIGFSGTRSGMTEAQKNNVRTLLPMLGKVEEAHHGDCVGSDVQFHMMCLCRNIPIIKHPASKVSSSMQAKCRGAAETRKTKPPLERNHDIVDETELMIFTPLQMEPILRSGTWATWRYAVKKGKSVHVVLPNGELLGEGWRKMVCSTP